jgi:dihydroxyacetone kinase-like protein
MTTLDASWVVRWADESARVVSADRAELSALDRAIGDGDHGENMVRGFDAVREQMKSVPDDATPSDVLRTIAMTLISSVGGAAGPLYGTAFLRASAAVAGARELGAVETAAVIGAGRDGIVQRGHAEVGDKTMVDAWSAAADAAAQSAAAGDDPAEVLRAAADAAARGAASTDGIVARKGRASYLGERAIGHRDPGAQSSALILAAAADVANAGD